MDKNFALRLKFVYMAFFLIGLLFVSRLFYLQVIRGDYYQAEANSQYASFDRDFFDRGSIYFKDKDGGLVVAAGIKRGYLIAIRPDLIERPEKTYEKISAALEKLGREDEDEFFLVSKEDFVRKAQRKGDPYEEVGYKLDERQAQAVASLGIKGVSIHSQRWRYYPGGRLASKVLGFVGYKGDRLVGRYGLEKYYEKILSSGGEKRAVVNPFAEVFLDIKKILNISEEPRGDLITTIDPEIQLFLENVLDSLYEKFSPEIAGGIVIEPKTGKVLAMSAKPDFDPNKYSRTKKFSYFLNPFTQNVFEFGSIMKPLTLAAAINERVITPETKYYDKGYVMVDGRKVANYENKSRGYVNMYDVLKYSLNTGAVFAQQKLGKEKFYQYIKKYGFGEKTGIDLPDEISGLISNLESGRDIEYATASFGQGIALTPIEMASALCSLANGGFIMRPYIVEKIERSGSSDIVFSPEKRRKVLNKYVAEEVSRMLVAATDSVFGGRREFRHYNVAAKTGTAQLPLENGKGYYEDQYLHSFFAYAPAFDPRFLVLMFMAKPQGVKYSIYSLREPTFQIVKFMLNYYNIPPDR